MSLTSTISRTPDALRRRLSAGLRHRSLTDNLRSLKVVHGIDFCSNDYLGLAAQGFDIHCHNHGSTGSRLISGHSDDIAQLEHQIAAFHGFESALLFGSGYSANSGLLSCIGERNDIVISDEYIHASLIDGIRLSHAKRSRFSHNDLDELKRQLARHQSRSGQVFVVIESLYSMDGDFAPIVKIADLCYQYGAALIIDEAHSVGVYGEQGRGIVHELGLQNSIFATVYTFGKAIGLHGAVICGPKLLKDHLINFCRPFIYSTAPAPHTVEATRLAYHRMEAANQARKNLQEIIAYFNTHVKTITLPDSYWAASQSPIQGLVVPENGKANALAQYLYDQGFAIKAILSPTVPAGQERLRISLHSYNTASEIDALANALSSFRGGRV